MVFLLPSSVLLALVLTAEVTLSTGNTGWNSPSAFYPLLLFALITSVHTYRHKQSCFYVFFSLQEVINVLAETLAMTLWCVSVTQPTVTVLGLSPCLHWASSPPTWAAWPAADWRQAGVRSRWTAAGQVSDDVSFHRDICGVGASLSSLLCLFQAWSWLSFPTRSTRRSGGSVEPWQTQQPLTSCLSLLVLRTSCCSSTSHLKVHSEKQIT